MDERIILNNTQLDLTINRLCCELIENHNDFSNTAILGLQPRGIFLAERIKERLQQMVDGELLCGNLDPTFHRDDFRRKDIPILPNTTDINFIIEDRKVILIDDVLYTGRTIRAGLDAMLAYGRPKLVELLVLIDRRYSRHLPIQPNYTGLRVDTIVKERVRVEWKESEGNDQVILYTPEEQ